MSLEKLKILTPDDVEDILELAEKIMHQIPSDKAGKFVSEFILNCCQISNLQDAWDSPYSSDQKLTHIGLTSMVYMYGLIKENQLVFKKLLQMAKDG